MDVNRDNMNELFRGYSMIFQKGFESAPGEYRKFAGEIPSTSAVEVFPFLERFGGMREWIGDRQIKHISSSKLTITNRDFEDTVAVKRNDIEDDKYGLYTPLIQELGFGAGELFHDLAVEALKNGATETWADGLEFFSPVRKYGDDATIDNTSTLTLTMENYATIRKRMLKFKGHSNRTLKVNPRLLIVGPDNEEAAYDIVKNSRKITAEIVGSGENAKVISGSVDNGFSGTAEVLMLPELSSQWFLADVSRPLKPVMVQKRRAPRITRMDRDDDENVFMRAEFIYGADARGAAFLSMPHLICGNFPA